MAVAIRTLRRRRRTAQRGKPMSQSQRWGKVVTTMPVPEGIITTSEILQPVQEEVVEVSTTEEDEDDETLVGEYIRATQLQ